MATETKMTEKKLRLLNLLREMFQLDQPDLDFGLYRIMHAKRAQVEAFLETEFDQLIDKVFASRGARQEEEAKKEYEATRQHAVEFGAPDPDAVPKVQQARARYEVVRLTGGEDAEIYDHIHRFFSRYYDEGDFMSLRRYGKGAAGGAESYAVPYDGSEVVLHWANKDQYYIKTTENFSHFSFDPRKALQKDERGINRQLFEEVGAGATALKVHFRVVDAAEGAHNNVKANDKDERYFIFDDQAPNAWDGTELVIPINYRPDPEQTGQKAKWQEKRSEQLVKKVLDTLKVAADGGHALAREYFEVLSREVPKGKDKKQQLLARYVAQYTASNTMDYFIHKDLGGFLRRELDFYLKNEVLKLDDFFGGEDVDVQAGGISEARVKAMQSALEKAQAIRLLAQRLIGFLAQLEDFQKRLWLKKKFVVETQYCITLDRIPERLYPEIATNDQQCEEWVRLFGIDEVVADTTTPAYTRPLTTGFLKANRFLPIDTSLFSDSFKQGLIGAIENLDGDTNGILIHSDNYQGLAFLSSYYHSAVSAIYIDPPYNTNATEIIYKNGYKNSSWLSLIQDRLTTSKKLLTGTGGHCLTIDDVEYANVRPLLDSVLGPDNHLASVPIRNNPQGRSTVTGFAVNHEYAIFHRGSGLFGSVGRLVRTDEQNARYREIDEQGLRYLWENFRKTGTDSARADRPKQYFPLFVSTATLAVRIPTMQWNEQEKEWQIEESPEAGEVVVWPNQTDGNAIAERVWKYSADRTATSLCHLKAERQSSGTIEIYRRNYINEDGKLPGTWWDDAKYAAGSHGTNLLTDMFGPDRIFSFPKSIYAVEDCIRVLKVNNQSVVLDYFGGSGTTAHAVINMNREDNGNRQYVLIEMGEHFDSALKPRIQKAVYSNDWKDGKPQGRKGISHALKYIRLESYEDCLNNLKLNALADSVANGGGAEMRRDYLLNYMLNVETQGSQSLLSVVEFRDPTAYQLEIKKPGSDERVKRNVDLIETFNWLIGLHVDKLHAGSRFSATFVRKPDPLLPEDANTRLQVEMLTEADDGAWWFRPVEGYVRTVPGDDRHRQSVLVLWRSLTDDSEQDAAVLEAFLTRQMKFDPTRREDKTLYDVIYINGTHNLPSLGKYGEVHLLEEEFHRRMWSGEDA